MGHDDRPVGGVDPRRSRFEQNTGCVRACWLLARPLVQFSVRCLWFVALPRYSYSARVCSAGMDPLGGRLFGREALVIDTRIAFTVGVFGHDAQCVRGKTFTLDCRARTRTVLSHLSNFVRELLDACGGSSVLRVPFGQPAWFLAVAKDGKEGPKWAQHYSFP